MLFQRVKSGGCWRPTQAVVVIVLCLLLNHAGALAADEDDVNWMEHLDKMAEDYLSTTADKDDTFSTITRTLVEGRSFFFDLFSAQTSDACKFRCKRGQ